MVTIGDRVGSYRVVRAIGSGGMGVVLEAVHERIRSRAAIKILHAQFSQDPEVRERFLTEALAVNLVRHPGIVSVFEHGQLEDNSAYIIMEYLDGESLHARILAAQRAHTAATAEGRSSSAATGAAAAIMDRAATLRLLRQLAWAMTAAHEKRIVHRDLKPENVMIVKDPFTLGGERVKILDFGIAKVLGAEGARRTGGLLGTPAYMAPEAWEGAATVDDKADVYSLGIILFECLAFVPPFEDARQNYLRWQELHRSVEPLRLRTVDPSIPEPLDALVARMLAKNPQHRPDMATVAAELEQLVGLNQRFRAGGFVREGEFYARRAADDSLFFTLLNGNSCFVLAPRKMGKTSLLRVVEKRLRSIRGPELTQGVSCVVLDLLSVESSGKSADRFYFELVRELYRGLGLPGIATDFWVKSGESAKNPADRFAELLRSLPSQVSEKTVIFIDHIEVLLRLPIAREDFFSALACLDEEPGSGEKKTERGPTSEVCYCVLGTAALPELLSDGSGKKKTSAELSRLEKARVIGLGELLREEARILLPGLNALGAASEKALAAILGWTDGHPYFTQLLCDMLSTRQLPDGTMQHIVDSLASEVIAKSKRREDPCFAFAEDGIRQAGALRPLMLTTYRQLLEGQREEALHRPPPGSDEERALNQLELLGFVRREGGSARVRSRLFAAVFSLEWLRGEEAVRPMASALAHWLSHQRHREYLLAGERLTEALAWARTREDLSSEEQAYLSASLERAQATQRRRVAVLLGVVAVLIASLFGVGLAFHSLRVAKRQVESQKARAEAALEEAMRARREAENARQKMVRALDAYEEARSAAEAAEKARAGALGEAARQRGVALSESQRAKAAQDRAILAAKEAQQASQSAQAASQRADEANQSVGRAMSEKAEAVAALEARVAQCEQTRQKVEGNVQRCQQSLDGKEAEAQSLRSTVGTLNAQVATLSTQVSTGTAQLAACRSSTGGNGKAAEPSGPPGENSPPREPAPAPLTPPATGAPSPASGGT